LAVFTFSSDLGGLSITGKAYFLNIYLPIKTTDIKYLNTKKL